MKKIFAALCIFSVLVTPTFANTPTTRPSDYDPTQWGGNNNVDFCKTYPDKCPDAGTSNRKAKKHSDTGTIIMVSVATAVVFAGAMWYIFKKAPSENNPGHVKLATF